MTSDKNSENKALHSKEQFAALGRFVQSFEQMVEAVRFGCHTMHMRPGPQTDMLRVVWHHRAMTAAPLFDIYRAMLAIFVSSENSVLTAEEQKFVIDVMKEEASEYSDLTKIRNELVHGTWFIGYGSADQEDYSEFLVTKTKVGASGTTQSEMPKTVGELSAFEKRCERLDRVLRWLPMFTLLTGRPEMPGPRISERMVRVDGRWDNPGYS